MDKAYIVELPGGSKVVADTREQVNAILKKNIGAKHMRVVSSDPAIPSADHARAVVGARGVTLKKEIRYAFVDANAEGGVGIVMAHLGEDGKPAYTAKPTNVQDILRGSNVLGLSDPKAIRSALGSRLNILGEMSGLYEVLLAESPGARITIVYDFRGVEDWIHGSWKKAQDPRLAALVQACRDIIRERPVDVTFKYQRGHQSTALGRDDFAELNGVADQAAKEGAARLRATRKTR